MSMPGDIREREHRKFRQSSKFPDKTVVAVTLEEPEDSTYTTNAEIHNISAPIANAEYSFSLPLKCKGFVIKARKIARVKFSYAPSSDYITIGRGGHWSDSNFYQSQTIYFQSDVDDNTFEIVTYT